MTREKNPGPIELLAPAGGMAALKAVLNAGADAAAKKLKELIDDKPVRLAFCADSKRDNFGRLLARVFLTKFLAADLEVGPEMVRGNYAKVYRN